MARGDYQRYLNLLKEYSTPRGLEVVAYCLMPNHVHLVAIPNRADSLATVLKPVHLRLAQYVNWTHGMIGRRWQGRFFSCPLDDRHTATAVRYVELNPVRAGLVREA
jgi:putative transposase